MGAQAHGMRFSSDFYLPRGILPSTKSPSRRALVVLSQSLRKTVGMSYLNLDAAGAEKGSEARENGARVWRGGAVQQDEYSNCFKQTCGTRIHARGLSGTLIHALER